MISIKILMIKVKFLELGLALPFVFEFHFIDLALNAALHMELPERVLPS